MEKGPASGAKAFGGSSSRRRLEIPVFSGEDAFASLWVSKMEQYFHANPMDDRAKLRAAIASLEGQASTWYRSWERLIAPTPPTWHSFKEAVVQRFQPEAADNSFVVLRQTGTVTEYRELFERLSRSIFVNGLKEEVKAELSSFEVESLSDLMDMAQVAEERTHRGKPALMKFWGKIEGRRVVMVVSSGSSDCFIAKRVVRELRLPTCETGQRFAFLTGGAVKSEGVCRGLTVKVQGAKMEITRDFFVLELGDGADIVLGGDWFGEFGKVYMHGDLTMELEFEGTVMTLKGDPSLTKHHEFWTIQRVG